MKIEKRILSVDAETDGLWGQIFAVAAILYNESGEEIDKFIFRSNVEINNEWVKENVIPTLDNIPIMGRYEDMLKSFSDFYMKYRDATTLWHMGHIVESNLFREMHRLGYIGEWDAPYVPIEVSAYLEQVGESPDSVDKYAKSHNIEIMDYGTTHNPLYDCEVAYKVYYDLCRLHS